MSRKIVIVGIVLLFIAVIIVIFLLSGITGSIQGKQVNPTITSFIPNPTYYPPPKATIFARMQQTQQAAALLPTRDFQEDYPSPYLTASVEDVLSGTWSGTLAGNGILIENEPPMIVHVPGEIDNPYDLNLIEWVEDRVDLSFTVWAGNRRIETEKGIVYVAVFPRQVRIWNTIAIEAPGNTGALEITGAVGERLILQSELSGTLYFDVPALQFVDSLEAKLPTATSVPTDISENFITDDAPDLPGKALDFSTVNTELNFYINSPTDYDWTRFYSQLPGTITVSLTHAPGNCRIRLVKLLEIQGAILGEDDSAGKGKKQVQISNTDPAEYMVRVWCQDGSYDLSKPYTLFFEAPKPQKIQPILECVAENSDGTYTAHFGYDNPNAFIIEIKEGNQNYFHPGLALRINQAEYFAPGRVVDFFTVLFDGNGLTWTLDGSSVTANRNSPRCP